MWQVELDIDKTRTIDAICLQEIRASLMRRMHVCIYAPEDPRLAEFLCLIYLVLFDTLSPQQAVKAMSPSLLKADDKLVSFLADLHERRAHFRKQTFEKIIYYADNGFGPDGLPESEESFSSSTER